MSIYTRVLKDQKAEVFKSYSTSDGQGGVTVVYRPITPTPLWCYSKVTTARVESLAGDSEYYLENREFTFNYNEDIHVFDLVRFKGKWFRIIEVANEYASETAIVAEGMGPSAPKDSEILPYSPDEVPDEITDNDLTQDN